MRLCLLILGATVLPFVWGWAVYWLMERLWPLPGEPAAASDAPSVVPPPPLPFDYRI